MAEGESVSQSVGQAGRREEQSRAGGSFCGVLLSSQSMAVFEDRQSFVVFGRDERHPAGKRGVWWWACCRGVFGMMCTPPFPEGAAAARHEFNESAKEIANATKIKIKMKADQIKRSKVK